MDGQTAVSTLKFRLNRGTNASSAFEAELLTELNNAMRRLEADAELPDILLTERAFIDIENLEPRVVKPADFLRERDEDDMQIQDTGATTQEDGYNELRKLNMDQARRRYPDEEQGRPQVYSDSGSYFRLRPIPNKTTYRMWMTYYASDVAITNDSSTNEWLTKYPDLVISEAGLVLAPVLRNQGAMALFQSMNTRERQRLITNEVAAREANFDPNPED